jgi:hypothetical protein
MLHREGAVKPSNPIRSLALSCEISHDQLTRTTGGASGTQIPGFEAEQKWLADHQELTRMTPAERASSADGRKFDQLRVEEWRRSNQIWERNAPPFTKCEVVGVDARGLSIWNCTR